MLNTPDAHTFRLFWYGRPVTSVTCEPVVFGLFWVVFRLFGFGFFLCPDGFAASFFSALNVARVKPIGMAFNASLLETKWLRTIMVFVLLILEH